MICLNEGSVRDCTGRQWIVPAGPAAQLFAQIIDQKLKISWPNNWAKSVNFQLNEGEKTIRPNKWPTCVKALAFQAPTLKWSLSWSWLLIMVKNMVLVMVESRVWSDFSVVSTHKVTKVGSRAYRAARKEYKMQDRKFWKYELYIYIFLVICDFAFSKSCVPWAADHNYQFLWLSVSRFLATQTRTKV